MKRIKWKKVLAYGLWGLICIGIVGTASYPFVSDYLLAQKQNAQIEKFNQNDRRRDTKDYLTSFYRRRSTSEAPQDPFAKAKSEKKNTVNVAESSLKTIALVSIPKIHEVLPVFDNTSATALDNGVGLLENTDPPIGGKGRHSVLTGHSGLSLNRLFTDLPKVKKGDKFYIKINGQVHAYQVDQLKTVTPDNLRYFATDPKQDYVTLVTCTPLFINSHRLLVRGHRIPYRKHVAITQNAGLTPLGKAVIATALSLVVIATMYLVLRNRNRQNTKKAKRLELK